jgi:hypothetical protein
MKSRLFLNKLQFTSFKFCSKNISVKINSNPPTTKPGNLAPLIPKCGPGSSVGIATGYGLDGPGIKSRWEARFSALVYTGPGAHSASCTIATGSFPGVKNGRFVTLIPHSLLVPWSWKSRPIPLLPLGAVRPLQSLSACTSGALYLFNTKVYNFESLLFVLQNHIFSHEES